MDLKQFETKDSFQLQMKRRFPFCNTNFSCNQNLPIMLNLTHNIKLHLQLQYFFTLKIKVQELEFYFTFFTPLSKIGNFMSGTLSLKLFPFHQTVKEISFDE